jgi:hypothetical protein
MVELDCHEVSVDLLEFEEARIKVVAKASRVSAGVICACDFLIAYAELRTGLDLLSSMVPSLVPDLSRAPEVLSWSNLQRRSGLKEKDWETLVSAI